MKRFIPVAAPALVGNEREYVLECLQSTWISSSGEFISRFEDGFAEFCRAKHAVACTNGTAALHLALMALSVGPGDEVLVPTLTFVATANAVKYCGAQPVLVDVEPETWNIDPEKIEECLSSNTKGIIVVHLYGHPANMDPILKIASTHGLFVMEDAAEAHGAEYAGRRVGALGEVGTFSFYGNKIITCGEGGIVVTNDDEMACRIRQLRGQGMDPDRRYWFPVVGYNYRMTNIAAAIGLAQLEKVDWHIQRRREVAAQYTELLGDVPGLRLQGVAPWARPVNWMTSVALDGEFPVSRDDLISGLALAGIETRPVFYPMHQLPMYRPQGEIRRFPVAEHLASRGLNLPSSALLSAEDIEYVCQELIGLASTGKEAIAEHAIPIPQRAS